MNAIFPPGSQPNKSQDIFKCADRVSPGDEPKDITAVKELYIPFDTTNKATHLRKNPFGTVIYKNQASAGKVYKAFDGKRLVVEVGCSTVIYILINASQPKKHHRLFIQSERAFSGDTTIRRDAATIAHNTRHIETIVKYEMFFILGVLSTASLASWLAVTGSDVTYLYASKKVVGDAAKKLSSALMRELDEIEKYAPTLHAKIWALIIAESSQNASNAVKMLPKTIVNDEKVQAQVAGVIFGKWAIPNGNPFGLWTIISTLLTQAAVKSVTKYGDAYLKAIDVRYKPIVEAMRQIDPMQPATLQKPASHLITLMRESGVNVSLTEANNILKEVANNKAKAYQNLSNIVNAITEFQQVAKK